jgi:hypothetical protein
MLPRTASGWGSAVSDSACHSCSQRSLHRSAAPAVAIGGPIELVVLSVKKLAARCRILGSGQTVNFRAKRPWDLAPGEIISVKPGKQWCTRASKAETPLD